jgi:hypothetical protein
MAHGDDVWVERGDGVGALHLGDGTLARLGEEDLPIPVPHPEDGAVVVEREALRGTRRRGRSLLNGRLWEGERELLGLPCGRIRIGGGGARGGLDLLLRSPRAGGRIWPQPLLQVEPREGPPNLGRLHLPLAIRHHETAALLAQGQSMLRKATLQLRPGAGPLQHRPGALLRLAQEATFLPLRLRRGGALHGGCGALDLGR